MAMFKVGDVVENLVTGNVGRIEKIDPNGDAWIKFDAYPDLQVVPPRLLRNHFRLAQFPPGYSRAYADPPGVYKEVGNHGDVDQYLKKQLDDNLRRVFG